MLKRSLKFFLFAFMLFAAAMMFGCGSDGDTGPQGPPGPQGPAGPAGPAGPGLDPASAEPEVCAICHANVDQEEHQGIYNMYTDTSTLELTITDVSSTGAGPYDATMTFTVKQNGVGLTLDQVLALDQLRFYTVTYNSTDETFENSVSFDNGTITGADGVFTILAEGIDYAPEQQTNAQAYGYVASEPLETEDLGEGSHVTLYNDVSNAALALPIDTTATYTSPANVAGCKKCHGDPYLKHGYRGAQVAGSLGDFSACKACHYDSRPGGHEDWQVLVTDPVRFTEIFDGDALTADEEAQYAYTANVMNDVHMSHSMEFGYPQSIANCNTCHEDNLAVIQDDENFTATTCKSCHAVTTTVAAGDENPINRHAAPSIQQLWIDKNVASFHDIVESDPCYDCHQSENNVGGAKLFSVLMPGYDPVIYNLDNDPPTKWSSDFTATIDKAEFVNNILSIEFSATGDSGGLSAADIVPTLEVGLYAYDTKDYLVGPHRRDVDDQRNLEVTFGSTNPRVSIEEGAVAGSWVATADVSAWADKIADGKIKRAEIAVLPALRDANDRVLALNAPSRTFDLTTNAFDDTYFDNIVDVKGDIEGDVTGSCNNCHDALATTFHSGNRGGNIVACRLCHDSLDDGSHLELQSRAIDSYVHAIHTFQAFDIGDIDFTNDVERVAYDVHIEHFFPRFTRKACEACHVKQSSPGNAKYKVPDQSKSLSARLSASDLVEGRNLNIPSYVTGPAYRSCGGCHRAEELNEGEFGELVSLNGHAKQNGYLFEVDDDTADSVLETVIDRIQSFFN